MGVNSKKKKKLDQEELFDCSFLYKEYLEAV